MKGEVTYKCVFQSNYLQEHHHTMTVGYSRHQKQTVKGIIGSGYTEALIYEILPHPDNVKRKTKG